MNKLSSNEVLRINIKYYRLLKGYTQASIAEVLEVDEKHYNRLENGVYNYTLKNLDILADFFDKEPWKLLKETYTQEDIDKIKK